MPREGGPHPDRASRKKFNTEFTEKCTLREDGSDGIIHPPDASLAETLFNHRVTPRAA